jgi:hypothetical protein
MAVSPETSAAIQQGQDARPGGMVTNPDASPSDVEAPDLGAGPSATPPTPPLPTQQGPRAPSVADRVAGFITGGQQTPGQLFRGILAGALTGMTAGAGQRHFGQGAAAGAQAAQQQRQQQFQNQLNLTREQQEAKVRQAQWVKLNHDNAEQALKAANLKAEAPGQAAEYENKAKELALAHGGEEIGVVRNPDDMTELHRLDPNLPQNVAKGQILTVPHVEAVTDADGKPTGEFRNDGFYAVYVPPEWKTQRIDKPLDVPVFNAPKKPGEEGTWTTHTFPAGSITNDEASRFIMDASKEQQKYFNDAQVAKATKANADAQAALAKAATSKEQAGQLQQAAQQNGLDLFNGDMAPSQLNKRAGVKGGVSMYDASIAAARAEAAKQGKTFSVEDAETFYKTKQGAIKEFTTGKDADNITAFNTAIAHLGELAEAAKAQNNGDFTALNEIAQRLSKAMGKEVPARYDAIHAAVTGEVGSVYKKGAPSEGELGRLEDVFNRAQSPGAAAGAIGETVNLMLGKLGSLDNKFRNATRGKSPSEYGINMISPESADTLQKLGIQPPAKFRTGTTPGDKGEAPKIPTGATKIVPGPDGKNHYTNDAGTQDFGVAP